MGNCGSAKKTIKADATKAAQSAAALAKNENIDPNLPNTARAILKPDAQEQQAQQAQQTVTNALNSLIKTTKNYKIKFLAIDDSYYPNKKPAIGESRSNLKPLNHESSMFPKVFAAEVLLKDCISSAIKDPNLNLINFKNFSAAVYKNTELREKMNLKLSEIIKEGDETTEHVIGLVYSGLKSLPIKITEYIAKNTNFYATINYQNEYKKELVVFAKDVLSPDYIKLFKVHYEIFNQEQNEIINEHTTYCNGLDFFYVSGCGDKGFSKSFFRIGLNESKLKSANAQIIQPLADMPIDLQLHAMLFVPESYIFAVGGESKAEKASRKVYFYDIKSNSWDEHSQLNQGRVQHSLCLVNDQFLYAIFGNKNNKKDDVRNMERLNLRSAERFWELISFETFDLQFFNIYGVAQFKHSLILLSVDEKMDTVEIEDNNERNLIFNLETRMLHLFSHENIRLVKENKALPPLMHSKSLLSNEEEIDHRLEFLERSFVPVSENILILSPFNHVKNKTNLVIIKDGNAKNEPFAHV